MIKYAGEDLQATDLWTAGRRCTSTGVGLVTVAPGASLAMTFDTKNAQITPDITISGTNNTTVAYNTAGEYEYGFGMRWHHTGTAVTSGDVFVYCLMNGVTEIAGKVQKPVLGNTGTNWYVVQAWDTRWFAAGDSWQVMLHNFTNVAMVEDNSGELIYMYSKRTMGGS